MNLEFVSTQKFLTDLSKKQLRQSDATVKSISIGAANEYKETTVLFIAKSMLEFDKI